jgi:hypothetical protein
LVLECIFSILKALRMGSCLYTDGRIISTVPLSPFTPRTSVRRRRNKRYMSNMLNSAAEVKADEQISRIPGRMFANGASNVACRFMQQGQKRTNQDAMLVGEV